MLANKTLKQYLEQNFYRTELVGQQYITYQSKENIFYSLGVYSRISL